jgi:hypothetical protein
MESNKQMQAVSYSKQEGEASWMWDTRLPSEREGSANNRKWLSHKKAVVLQRWKHKY